MNKPVRLLAMAVESRAEQPETPPLLVLDPVIVADRIGGAGASRLPPFVGDPLRPVGLCHPMPAAPPHEPKRRVIGQQPERVHRLRRVEQPDRPYPLSVLQHPHPPSASRWVPPLPHRGRGS